MKINKDKLRLAMARKCMNARELASAVECSAESIHQILSGRRNVTTKKLGRIAKALDVDVTEIIDQEGE